jgi:predicted transposase/invertase (TIGR01784 family)
MQMASHKYFKDRTLFYATFPIQSQAKKGEWDFNLKKVYAIGILGFCFDDQSGTRPNEVKTVVQLHNSDSKELFYDKLNFIFLEMPKFVKGLPECETGFEKWLYVLKNLHQLERMPEKLMEQIFKKLFTVAEIAKLNVVEYHEYIQSRKAFWDNYSAYYTATEKGREAGMQAGMEAGMQAGMEKGMQAGMQKGIQLGQLEGTLSTIVSMYHDGDIGLEKAKAKICAHLGQGEDELVYQYLNQLPQE